MIALLLLRQSSSLFLSPCLRLRQLSRGWQRGCIAALLFSRGVPVSQFLTGVSLTAEQYCAALLLSRGLTVSQCKMQFRCKMPLAWSAFASSEFCSLPRSASPRMSVATRTACAVRFVLCHCASHGAASESALRVSYAWQAQSSSRVLSVSHEGLSRSHDHFQASVLVNHQN